MNVTEFQFEEISSSGLVGRLSSAADWLMPRSRSSCPCRHAPGLAGGGYGSGVTYGSV